MTVHIYYSVLSDNKILIIVNQLLEIENCIIIVLELVL